jgi:hypothetical protein
MDPVTLKENFTNQIKTLDEQIAQLEAEREKAKEYKLKLLGGLETLELLLSQEASVTEASIPEGVAIEESTPAKATTGRSTTKK